MKEVGGSKEAGKDEPEGTDSEGSDEFDIGELRPLSK